MNTLNDTTLTLPRILCWFSCGAPSAVAAKLILDAHRNTREVLVVNCDTRPSEHSDNYRFSTAVEAWLEQPIIYLRNPAYSTVDDVFEKHRYMSGVGGARCTTELKKVPRHNFARADDCHVFGFCYGELGRITRFKKHNPDLYTAYPLQLAKLTKQNCQDIITAAGIALPAMYLLGFDNNNCPGCVKASTPWYWDKVRRHFPEVFARRAAQSRAIGCRLVEIKHHVRIFLDELPPGPFTHGRRKEDMSCGPECAGGKT